MITELTFPDRLAREVGLREASLRGLREVVLLAGPNGSGKSRYLSLIPKVIQEATQAKPRVTKQERDILGYRERMPREAKDKKSIESFESAIAAAERQLMEARPIADLVLTSDRRIPTPLLLTSAGLIDSFAPLAGTTPSDFETTLKKLPRERLPAIYQALPVYVAHVARTLYAAEHPKFVPDPKALEGLKDVQAYCQLVEDLLGTELSFAASSSGAQPLLFGRPLDLMELSAGQRLLLWWAPYLHLQAKSRLNGAVLLVDEPEKHLHPASAIRVLEALRQATGADGQLWIATHSTAIVAHYGFQSVFSVRDQGVDYSGNRVDRIMDGLLGGDGSRRKMLDFLGDAEQANFLRFAAECLRPPSVAAHREGDLQETQFARIARTRIQQGGSLRVLDYAAGRGRLAIALADDEACHPIEYYSFEDSDRDDLRAECLASIARLHRDNPASRYLTDLAEVQGANRVDVVVMCNVLHEIPPANWLQHFERCASALKEEGVLILMEDIEPSIGEMPHSGGLIILTVDEARALFGGDDAVRSLEEGPRLSAIEVPRRCLSLASTETLVAALERVRGRTMAGIQALREDVTDPDPRRGRRHALLAVMHANAGIEAKRLADANSKS